MDKNMKAAVIIFHKNVTTYYKKEWIDKCMDSIKNQTYRDFVVLEVDYGGDGNVIFKDNRAVYYTARNMDNHALAHNFLLDMAFNVYGCDCAFNVNVDDYYALNRFEKQLPYIEQGYDVVSSNFYRINNDESIKQPFAFNARDIEREAAKGHNVIAHPVCCYSRNFWLNCDKLNPADIPQDDFVLWKKSYKKGFRFVILKDFLLFQRIHENNISKKR